MAKQLQDSSPLVVFLMYIAAAFVGVCGYQFFFPPESIMIEILGCFRFSWRFTNGIITFIELFPALAFSGLVLPFGLKEHSEGGYAGTTFVGKKGFSSVFLKYLSWPVITTCLSAVSYGLLFFLVLPLTMNLSNSIQDRSELFARAKLKAAEKAEAGQWAEASQFIDICEGIWPDSEEISQLKIRLIDSLSSYHRSLDESIENEGITKPVWEGIPGDPVNAVDALRLAEDAFSKEQYYDAHWLATLAEKLAGEGAAEINIARVLASRAWEKISSMEPNAQEKERHSLYRMKREAYEAMNSGDWITAFYSFQDLSVLTPGDPDVSKYLDACKTGVARAAFFIDELDLSIGTTLREPAFSMPGSDGGRLILRFASLAVFKDNAYAWGTEVLASDGEGRLRYRIGSEYAKLIPIVGRDSEGNPSGRTVLLLHALDRADKNKSIMPVWIDEGDSSDREYGANQIMLPVNFDDFLLLSKVRQGTQTLNLRELFTAEKSFENFGLLRESFRAEIFRRLGYTLFFLPMALLALVLGWRYRARKKPRYVYVPMLVFLPMVFYGAVHLYRNIINNFSIWLSLNAGLTMALVCLCAGAGVFFILTLVLLASQHG